MAGIVPMPIRTRDGSIEAQLAGGKRRADGGGRGTSEAAARRAKRRGRRSPTSRKQSSAAPWRAVGCFHGRRMARCSERRGGVLRLRFVVNASGRARRGDTQRTADWWMLPEVNRCAQAHVSQRADPLRVGTRVRYCVGHAPSNA